MERKISVYGRSRTGGRCPRAENEEFPLAEKLWEEYRGQKNDMPEERVFAVFENGVLAATARCTRHPDGLEMDCVFASERFRGKGYARLAVQALIDACGKEQIFIHSTIVLISFYKTFGFVPIPEDQLPRPSGSGSSSALARWWAAMSAR